MPCHPFRLLCLENGTTRFSEDERATALPRTRAPFGVCYSGPAPTLEGLNHLAASPGTGHHTGSSTASRIRIHRQFRDHVAQPGYYGRSYADTCSLPSKPQFPQGLIGQEISGGRSQKGPLTHSAEFFAVRHRLLENFLASTPARPVAPFTVELFTFGDLGRYPIPGFGLGSLCHHNRGSLRELG